MPEIMGAGAALLDYDNDGDLDVYLIQGTALDPGKQPLFPPPAGVKPGNRLFRNLLSPTGTLHFVDVTESAGVGHIGYGMGAATGDYDNDGFLDLYVTNVGRNVLYHNNGDGTFADVTGKAGVDDARWSTSAAFLDYDSDGFLDLFVGNYVDFTAKGNKHCYAPTGEPDYCTPMAYTPVPSRLFHNRGNGTFVDVTESSGIGSSYGPALGVLCADFNGDGRTDIFVANDTAANRLWVNQGGGTFREAALEAGVAYNADGRAKAGMGVTAEEVDDDGTLTLLVTNLTREGATLFRGNRKGLFEDVTSHDGLATPTFGFTGFGTSWFDYDNDGRLDLFIANGAVTIVESLRAQPYPYGQSNLLFHNEGQHRFSEVSGRRRTCVPAHRCRPWRGDRRHRQRRGCRCPRDQQQRLRAPPSQRCRGPAALARSAPGRHEEQSVRHRRTCCATAGRRGAAVAQGAYGLELSECQRCAGSLRPRGAFRRAGPRGAVARRLQRNVGQRQTRPTSLSFGKARVSHGFNVSEVAPFLFRPARIHRCHHRP